MEFNTFRTNLLEQWMDKKPRGFDKDKWRKRFRPPSRKAWKEKKRIERVAEQLAYEKRTNLIPPNERHVCMEHRVDPDRARFLDMPKLALELSKHTYLRGLHLSRCVVDDRCLKILAKALRTTTAPLEVLELRSNSMVDSGAQHIFDLLFDGKLPTLQKLGLGYNKLTKRSAQIMGKLLLIGCDMEEQGKGEDEKEEKREEKERDYASKYQDDEEKESSSSKRESKTRRPPLRLTSIDLYDNNGVTPLFRRISLFKGSRGIGHAGVRHLSNALKWTRVPLTSLNLQNTNMGSRGVQALGEALEWTSCPISTIVLRDNCLGDVGLASLANSLERRACSTGNESDGSSASGASGASKSGGKQDGTRQRRPPSRRLPLTSLDVSRNQIGDAGVIQLAKAISMMGPSPVDSAADSDEEKKQKQTQQQQTTTSITEGKRRRHGCSRMPLRSVNLSCNRVSDVGVTALAYALRQFPDEHPLTELNLAENLVTHVGVQDLCWAMSLSKSKRFKHLDLCDNVNIGDVGGMALARCLIDTKLPLTTLRLNNVGLTNVSALLLAETLRESAAPIESLPIRGNNITSHLKGFVKNWVLFRESQVESEEEDSGMEMDDDDDVSVRSVVGAGVEEEVVVEEEEEED